MHVYTGMEGIGTCSRSVKAKAYADGGAQVHGGGAILPRRLGSKGGEVEKSHEGPKILVVLIR